MFTPCWLTMSGLVHKILHAGLSFSPSTGLRQIRTDTLDKLNTAEAQDESFWVLILPLEKSTICKSDTSILELI